jgi:hypothetical protein
MREAMRSGGTPRARRSSRDAGELDRRAGDVTHRQRGAAARVAVELGQDDAGERQRSRNARAVLHGVLALHRVDHEQRLDRPTPRAARRSRASSPGRSRAPAVSTISTSW